MARNIENYIPPIKEDGLVTAKGITSSSASAGIGYATGAGSSVTQITNRSTGVTVTGVSTLFVQAQLLPHPATAAATAAPA